MLLDGTLNAHLKEIQETAQNRVEQIINKLKSLPKNLTAKTYGVIITVLINDRIIRPITDGERGALYRALRDIYDDNRNIGTRQGVSKYICSAAVSDLDIAAAKELLA